MHILPRSTTTTVLANEPINEVSGKNREHQIALGAREKLLLTRVNDRVEQHAVSIYVNCVAMLCENQNRNGKANLDE